VTKYLTMKHRMACLVVIGVVASVVLAACGGRHLATKQPSAAAPRAQAEKGHHADGVASCAWIRAYPVVTLDLSDRGQPPAVRARVGQRVSVRSAYGTNGMRTPETEGHACRLSVSTASSGAVTAVYVMQAAGTVSFTSSFLRPTDAMDPAMRGVVRVAGR
jgi:hypothetical protein